MNDYESAVNELMAGHTGNCIDYFTNNNRYLELAYCKFLNGNTRDAFNLFLKCDSPRGLWAKKLCLLFNDCLENVPSYFQIRNFLEIDLNWFMNLNKILYVNKLIEYSDLFYEINSESYKFFARTFINNGLFDEAKKYIEKSKSKFFKDPELHYVDSIYYSNIGDYESALSAVENCLKIIPEYYPAKKAKEKLEQKIHTI